ncbi:MAG: alpha-galactosidase [Paraprevotella sp.]|nr:alpha-galactosidase [Paraprevotella sp.]
MYPFRVRLCYKAYKDIDMIETWAEISHTEKKDVILKRFDSGSFLLRRGDVWISHLHGSWAAETNVTAEPLTPGIKMIENVDGARGSHIDHPEVMFSLDGPPQEDAGRVVGAALCWSGNYSIRVSTDNNFAHRIFAGIDNESSEYALKPKQTFDTPRLALTYSPEGLGGASRNFHRWARQGGMLHHGDRVRDILLNSWEGVYLDVKEESLHRMMSDAAAMGVELFVMDDGWFGRKYRRVNDDAALGDWTVDTLKLPHGIQGLIDTARADGLKFGIWIEPESANSRSELFEKHPDWVLRAPGRPLSYGRGGTQLLLDLCNPAVQDYVFSIVDRLLTDYPQIAYIKWDANVELKNFGSSYLPANRQSQLYVDYHRGLESVLRRIRARYPDVTMQACGGGGGRANYGLRPYFDEFWVSDNTDALQRIYTQWGASYFYPSNAMAQHISASPNHQTGRSIPIKFRCDVAMSGRLGLELQPSQMTPQERSQTEQAIRDYKTVRDVIQLGDLYRLVSPYDHRGVAALMYTAAGDSGHAVSFAYKTEHFANQVIPRVCLRGLDPLKTYRVRELDAPTGGQPCFLHDKTFSGALLMHTGIELPLNGEYASCVLEFTAE